MHLFVATPMYGGQCTGFYTQSILQLQKACDKAGVNVTFSFMFNESLITRARNAMVHQFLKTEATHLMFIDADIRFDANDLLTMLGWEKDVICGIYPKKEINWQLVRQAIARGEPDDQLRYHTGSFVVNLVNYDGEVTVPVNQPIEIWNGGTGFMLVRRNVFEEMAANVPTYTNNVLDLNGELKNDPIHEFFTTSICKHSNVLLSEDYHFCTILREHGYSIYAAPWAKLSHVGSYIFEGQLTSTPQENV